MLYILFSTILLLPTWLGFGLFFQRLFNVSNLPVSLSAVLGMLGLSIFLTIIAFFMPIGIEVEIFILFFGILNFIFHKGYLLFDFIFYKQNVFLLILLFITLFFGSFYPFILDHFGYYVPTISLLNNAGIIKGVSNLDMILGQFSFWHILQSGFSLFSDIYLRINTIFLIVFCIYIWERKRWIFLLFLPVFFLFSQSPSPDLPAIVLSLIVLSELLLDNKYYGFLFAISVWVFAIKPTMLWVPLFVFLYIIFICKARFVVLFSYLFSGLCIGILYFAKNIWTFGFPIFPVSVLDIGVYWKPNEELLKISSQVAILKTYDFQYTLAEIERFSMIELFFNWLTLSGLKSVMNMGLIFFLVFFIIFSLFHKSRVITLLCVSVLIKSILVVLFSAQYRFFLDVFFIVFFILFYKNFSYLKSVSFFTFFSIILFFLFSFPTIIQNVVPSFTLGKFMKGFEVKQLLVPSHYTLKKYNKGKVGNLDFYYSENYPFIFDTPIPSISLRLLKTYYEMKIFPQKVGNDIRDGIIWEKISPEEERQLYEIVKSIE